MSKLHLEKILELAQSLQDYSAEKITDTPLEELLPFLNVLEEVVHCDTDRASVSPTLSDGKLQNASQVIRDFHRQLTVKMETEQAQKILDASKPWPWLRNYYFYKDYQGLIIREQEMTGFAPYERLAYIGGGALPLSLKEADAMLRLAGDGAFRVEGADPKTIPFRRADAVARRRSAPPRHRGLPR